MKSWNSILSDGCYYLSIRNAVVNCPLQVLIIMLNFNILAVYKDWSLNKKIFETYRSSKTDNPTIDPLNGVSKDQLEKEQCSAHPYRVTDGCPTVVWALWRNSVDLAHWKLLKNDIHFYLKMFGLFYYNICILKNLFLSIHIT